MGIVVVIVKVHDDDDVILMVTVDVDRVGDVIVIVDADR